MTKCALTPFPKNSDGRPARGGTGATVACMDPVRQATRPRGTGDTQGSRPVVTAPEPWLAWLGSVVVVVLVPAGGGFVLLSREERRACEPGLLCASPAARRRMRLSLWAATVLSVPLLTFPWWAQVLHSR